MPSTPRLGRGELERQVLAFMARGPSTVRDCALALGRDIHTVKTTVRRLEESGALRVAGFAKAVREDALRAGGRLAQLYALPGAAVADEDAEDEAPPVRPATRSPDGTATPAPYATGFRWWNVSW